MKIGIPRTIRRHGFLMQSEIQYLSRRSIGDQKQRRAVRLISRKVHRYFWCWLRQRQQYRHQHHCQHRDRDHDPEQFIFHFVPDSNTAPPTTVSFVKYRAGSQTSHCLGLRPIFTRAR